MILTIQASSSLLLLAVSCAVARAKICNICHDASYPGKENSQIVILPGLMPRTRYSCKELYDLGRQDDGITDQICNPLVGYAAEPCGCGEFNPYKNGVNPYKWTVSTPTEVVVLSPLRPPTPPVAAFWSWPKSPVDELVRPPAPAPTGGPSSQLALSSVHLPTPQVVLSPLRLPTLQIFLSSIWRVPTPQVVLSPARPPSTVPVSEPIKKPDDTENKGGRLRGA